MKIAEACIAMTSGSSKLERQEKEESLTVWSDAREENIRDTLIISGGFRNRSTLGGDDLLRTIEEESPLLPASGTSGLSEAEELALSDEDRIKIRLIESFIESLTGKKIKLTVPKLLMPRAQTAQTAEGVRPAAGQSAQRLGWGIIYSYRESCYEKETMSFGATGIVRTKDGKEINLEVSLNMTREFVEEYSIQIRAGDAKRIDPLVINLGTAAPSLSTTRFSFDLDADGTSELIPFVSAGSGFLALDKNNDGLINDGSELFGPQSGDGFSDLARFDEDNNQWIDENDAIFNKLRIWTVDAGGNKTLLALGAAGVGAIYLGSANSPFELKATGYEELGQIQKTGIFLFESGRAGTVQHIDLAV